jgi:hypothetical protein
MKNYPRIVSAVVGVLYLMPARAGVGDAIVAARAACGGISESVRKLQGMVGINTAISGGGTVAAGGALYAGIKKDQSDKLAERIQEGLDKLGKNELSDEEFFHLIGRIADWKAEQDRQTGLERARDAEIKKSTNLGHWRTGLMAGSTALNIGGAIVSDKNKNDGIEIKDQVAECLSAVKALRAEAMQSLIDGGADAGDIVAAQKIADACGRFVMRDAENIPKRQDVAKWSSVAGVGTGALGVAASAAANVKAVRDNKSDDGKKTEKSLNLAANVLAGASVVAGGVATGFNIAAIASVGKVLGIAEECEGALQ